MLDDGAVVSNGSRGEMRTCRGYTGAQPAARRPEPGEPGARCDGGGRSLRGPLVGRDVGRLERHGIPRSRWDSLSGWFAQVREDSLDVGAGESGAAAVVVDARWMSAGGTVTARSRSELDAGGAGEVGAVAGVPPRDVDVRLSRTDVVMCIAA